MDSVNFIEKIVSQNKETIALLGVVFSGITLWLAFRIQKLFANNHMKTKQIEHICNLIELLNNSKITVAFSTYHKGGGYGSHGLGLLFNIFELGNYDKIENGGSNMTYEDEIVLFDTKSNQILDIKGYIDHPLTPKKIADELLNFYNSSCLFIDNEDPNLDFEEFVLIKTDILEEKTIFNNTKKGSLIRGDAVAFLSWKNLKEYAKTLKWVIGKWLEENGIGDNNMRVDFKNSS